MIGVILDEFWPFIIAIPGVVIGFIGLFLSRRDKAARKAAERRIDTFQEVREHEREASQMDDTSLADRITRKP